ncbi:MAG: hypothetical protein LUI60_04945 [Clostridia bacterium]|nr:hypothetical protein [Clostridia bacterium]
MKKFFISISVASLAAVCILCACTPKPVTLWCGSSLSDAHFSFEYSAANSTYDGQNRSFSVKDEEDFGEFLTSLDEYNGMIQFADNSERQAYSFLSDGDVFVCYSTNDEGGYTLRSSIFTIDGYDFYYPPTERNFDYSVSLDYSGVNSYITTTVQDWDYFKNYYSNIQCAVVIDETKTVTFQNVTLTVDDGQVYWTIDFGGE